METIVLTPFFHRGREVIGLYFPKNYALSTIIKQVEGARWSQTNGCWYIPCSRYFYNGLVAATVNYAGIDKSKLRDYLLQKQALVADTQKPLQKSTVEIINRYPLHEHHLEALNAYRKLLVLKNYSIRTITTYCNVFHHLLRLLGERRAEDLDKNNLQSYLLWLYRKEGCSEAYIHTTINALKFYYEKVLGKDRDLYDLPRPKRPGQLPDVMAGEEIEVLFTGMDNLKHKAILMTCYSAGLRVSELVKLKVEDIDGKRMMIHVRNGKGNKDRYVPLASKVRDVLREYYRQYRPKEYLFEGQYGGPYSCRSVQAVLKEAKKRVRIRKKGSVHGLRHTYATHLVENGIDIRCIQELLGHSNITTTMRYTHISRKELGRIQPDRC